MGRPKHMCECGRKALTLVRFGRFRSRKARAATPYAVRGHTQCLQCYRREWDAIKAKGA